jgi:hypothetical protein
MSAKMAGGKVWVTCSALIRPADYLGHAAHWWYLLSLFFSVKKDAICTWPPPQIASHRQLWPLQNRQHPMAENCWLPEAFWGRFWGGMLPRPCFSADLQPKQWATCETLRNSILYALHKQSSCWDISKLPLAADGLYSPPCF